MAKITDIDVNKMGDAIHPLDTETVRDAYRRGDFPRAEMVKDLDRRYRWDLLWAAGGWRIIPNDVTDAHIDTALRKIVPVL